MVQFVQSVYSVITSAFAAASPQMRRSLKIVATPPRAVAVSTGFAGNLVAVAHHTGIQTNPSAPHTTNTLRQPYTGAITATISGAAMLPIVMPT